VKFVKNSNRVKFDIYKVESKRGSVYTSKTNTENRKAINLDIQDVVSPLKRPETELTENYANNG
jgi:hypothetical protein